MSSDLFDFKDMDELDKKIAERQARPSLVSKMKDKNKANQSKKLLSFSNDLGQYWYIYLFLAVSSIFTMTLGLYMGLAPIFDPVKMTLTYQTDVMHIFLSIVYMISFVGVTEVAFVIGKWLFFTREEHNLAQRISTIVMMVVAGLSILGTGVAGGMVIASQISFLTAFVEIPDAAQKWVVIIIPVLITFYTFLVTIYSLSSESAASERLLSETKRANDIDSQTRARAIEQISGEQLQVAELKRCLQLVSDGKYTAAEAQAAIRAGKLLGQEEKRQGKDLDGDGKVGTIKPIPESVLARSNGNGSHPT